MSVSQVTMGVDRGGTSPPEFGVGDARANCPLIFCHIGTKKSILWPSKYIKIRFRPGLCPGPRWELTTLPRPLNRLSRGHPSHTPPYSNLFGAHHASPKILARSTPMQVTSIIISKMYF